MRFILLLFLATLLFQAETLKAQQANPNNIGSVKGLLKDTVRNYTLKSATVSLFKSDSVLVNYQLSNNYGEFTFKNIALNTKMYIEVSHVGYEVYRKAFTVTEAGQALDLKMLVLKQRDIMLNEVEIKIPPISMNGDTLEFNAAAFKLDSNAVVEDLLRKIPNVTLWGDGQITVNGREVKSLLVNGKQFFGGDFKMATQNISKNALEKVQVYSTRDEKNPLDSTLSVNLKLKKGKELGYFGKIGAGYGTDERYEVDGNLNAFTPKMQIGIIGASNNINKLANNIRTLTDNSTFKGGGTNVAYQSDFRQTGLNQPNVGGATFTYNFKEKQDWQNASTLKANYFIQNRNVENLVNTQTTTIINGGSQVFDSNTNQSENVFTDQKFDSGFDYAKRNQRLNVTQSMFHNSGATENNIQRSAFSNENILTSTNNTIGTNDYVNRGINFGINYNMSPNYLTRKKHPFSGIEAKYDFSANENVNDRTDLTSFRLIGDPTANRDFDRRYDNQQNNINQLLDVKLPNLKTMLFDGNRLADFDFALTNRLTLNQSKSDNKVTDLNTTTNNYDVNPYLTNTTKVNVVDETPGLTITKGFNKNLANRYSKHLIISVSAKQNFIFQDNQSIKSFQNIKRNYSNFIPEANISYTDYQYGEYFKNISLNFNSFVSIPNLQQLAPLVDSTNLYYLQVGNIKLKEAMNRVLSTSFSHNDQTSKNVLNYGANISAGATANKIVDSIFIDEQNRRTVFLTNANGNKYLNASANIRKTFKLKTTELQVALNGGLNLAKNPGYVNDVFSYANTLNTNGTLQFNFTYKDKFATELSQNFNSYNSKQVAFNTSYSGVNLATNLSSSVIITKKLTLSSNVSYNTSKSTNAETINFTIWNANVTYRFLKGNNAEFKFSALDLLHQNTNVINYGNANSFTLGTQQVLQQYFLTTLSYFPRKFGKSAVKK